MMYTCVSCGRDTPWEEAIDRVKRERVTWEPAAIAPKPKPEIPDYSTPILAWRIWTVDVAADRLVSQVRQPVAWTPYAALEARHLPRSHHGRTCDCPECWADRFGAARCNGTPCDGHVPLVAPGCGLYGYKSSAALRAGQRRDYQQYPSMEKPPLVVGTVHLWGRMVEHEHGYRAQFAYPATFVYGHKCDARAFATTYGVPYQEDESWKSEYPSDDSWPNPLSLPFPSGFQIVRMSAVYLAPTPSPIPIPSPNSSLLAPSNAPSPIIVPRLPQLQLPVGWILDDDEDGTTSIHYRKIKKAPTPAKPKGLEQPSFNLLKPLHWFYDKGRKLWLRIWDETPEAWKDFVRGSCSFCGLPRRECRALAKQYGHGVYRH
jgi:hypothetical protein